jgi:hypothetical protein
VMAALPRTRSAKVDYPALKAGLIAAEGDGAQHAPPAAAPPGSGAQDVGERRA